MKQEIDIKNINLEKFLKIIIVLSCSFLSFLFASGYKEIYIWIGMFVSLILSFYYIYMRYRVKEINIKKLLISIFIGCFIVKRMSFYVVKNLVINSLFNFIGVSISDGLKFNVLGILALPSLMFFIYLFIDKIIPLIKKFINSFSKTEKIYFGVIVIIGVISSVLINRYTTAFTFPTSKGTFHPFDVIYVSDSGTLASGDAYFNPSHSENDIRQPLFGVLSLPFSVPARIISDVCFFLNPYYEYYTIMIIAQFGLIAITTIMIARLMNIKEKNKKYLYLLFSCSYPYMIWSITLEQYPIVLFYLILTLYIHSKKPDKVNYAYIGAVGSLITSGIIFPAIVKFKNIKQWIKNVFKCFIMFIFVLCIGGQVSKFTDFTVLKYLLTTFAGGKSTFLDNIYQYFNFIRGTFIAPIGKVFVKEVKYHIVQPKSLDILGLLVIVMCIVSFIINRKKIFAKISMLWILFSVAILLIIGWGTSGNGLILYGLYFAWAFLAMYYMFIERICKRENIFKIVMICSCIIMLYFNAHELIEVLKFAFKYY